MEFSVFPPANLLGHSHQRPRIGMNGPVDDLLHLAHLHHVAGVHDREAIAEPGDDSEVVGDPHQGQSELLSQTFDQRGRSGSES